MKKRKRVPIGGRLRRKSRRRKKARTAMFAAIDTLVRMYDKRVGLCELLRGLNHRANRQN